jgi:hypothetical protein
MGHSGEGCCQIFISECVLYNINHYGALTNTANISNMHNHSGFINENIHGKSAFSFPTVIFCTLRKKKCLKTFM